MIICWDNLENLKFTKKGNFKMNGRGTPYKEYDTCLACGEPYLGEKNNRNYCSYVNNATRIHINNQDVNTTN
jgi:hypothetical protein